MAYAHDLCAKCELNKKYGKKKTIPILTKKGTL